MNFKIITLILITLFFFASSSILARAAFISDSIDAYSFTFFRLFFGTLTLLFILYFKERKLNFTIKKNWDSSFMLFLYAICFSYAYINLDAGLGALILFAVVQITIIIASVLRKEKLNSTKFLGIIISFSGLVYLLYPSAQFELSLYHSFLMAIAGIAWGVYTILGKNSSNATLHTTDNFIKSLVFLGLFFIFFAKDINISTYGVILAFISGGVTSSIGYILWYYLLPRLQVMTSGILQLLIPPIAIFLGVIFLHEELTLKLILSTITILVGIVIYLRSK